jgi:Holliday junction DNA helicase RuvA
VYDHLVGEVVEAHGTKVVLRVGGVGYELKTPVATSSGLRVGDSARLWTILHVVDGMPSLLGFGSPSERELARRVLAVSGVGPSIALAILSTYDPPTFGHLVLQNDVAALKRVKGVGAKTAERLCLELRDRIAQLDLGALGPAAPAPAGLTPAAQDAVAALVTLGFAERDARQKVEKIATDDPDAPTEQLIKRVLRGG